ncbi:MAG: hypothetical protein GTN78_21860 [Gemmatimonadales bacterium]|nr:hypothetical protein [Gemmatimonadales bacterium]
MSTAGTERVFERGDLVWRTIDGERTAAVVAAVEEGPIGRFYTLQIGGIRRAPLYGAEQLEPRDPPQGDWD